MKTVEEHKCFNGLQYVFEHESPTTQCTMRFGLFLPPQAQFQKVPVLYWLSGLTCSEQNFITKSGAQRIASQLGLAIVNPDTSPRGLPDTDEWNSAMGAGFYVDATQAPWSKNFKMYSYIQQELPALLRQHCPEINQNVCGITGHSMGGHGALILALKNPDQYQSVSAFAPICAPSRSPWGEQAFTRFLGKDKSLWKNYDACELLSAVGWPHQGILIDQGTADPFMKQELNPDWLAAAAYKAGVNLELRKQSGYDHSYYFIASFMEDHLRFHAQRLLGSLAH